MPPPKSSDKTNPTTNGLNKSPFKKLPVEVRNRIYRLVFQDTTYQTKATEWCGAKAMTHKGRWVWNSKKSSSGSSSLRRTSGPALVFVCKEFNKEALPVFYATTTFNFYNVTELKTWLGIIGEKHRKMLTDVQIHITAGLDFFWGDVRKTPVMAHKKWAQKCAAKIKVVHKDYKLAEGVLKVDFPKLLVSEESVWTATPKELAAEMLEKVNAKIKRRPNWQPDIKIVMRNLMAKQIKNRHGGRQARRLASWQETIFAGCMDR